MLPPNEKTFTIDTTGEKTGTKYEGSFTVKCVLTNRETMEVGLRSDRYNEGSQTLPTMFKLFNRAIAEVEVRVKHDKRPMAPNWWIDSDNGKDLLDQNVVFEVYGKCIEAEKDWTEGLVKKEVT